MVDNDRINKRKKLLRRGFLFKKIAFILIKICTFAALIPLLDLYLVLT